MSDSYTVELWQHRAILDRDGAVFAAWLADHEERLRLSLRSFARVVDVEVVVQETALRLWQLAHRIEPDGKPGFLYRWSVTVARNLARDMARRAGREVPLDDDDARTPTDSTPALEPDPLLRRTILDCIAKLPGMPRKVLTVRFESGGGSADRVLAQSIGMGFDAFRKNLSRARRLVEECLKRAGVDLRSVRS